MQINTQLTRLEMPIRRYFIDLNKMPCKCLQHRGISSYCTQSPIVYFNIGGYNK